MAKYRSYICPECQGQFSFLHHPSDEPPPRFCPLCGHDSHAEEAVVRDFIAGIVAPHVQNRIVVQAVDGTYRGMQNAAEAQIDRAVEMTGEDRSEFDNMKLNNMRDDMREGDIAAVPVDNSVSRAMTAAPNISGFQNPQAMAFAAQAHTGSDAHAGAKMAGTLRRNHAANGGPVYEAPTVETMTRGRGTKF